jgi:hypothetical protein
MDLKAFQTEYTPISTSEKDKKVLPDDGYALVESIYSLAENIQKLINIIARVKK